MDTVSLVGVDLGKHSFHLHAQDASGRMVLRKKLTRGQMLTLLSNFPSCVVVMEACAGAHWIARRVQALGHEAKLISPQFVKPFRQGNKNDFADAQAICEAASRPSMRFVSAHNEAQQIVSALHRVRESLVRDRTGTINQIHAFLLEFGISLPRGMAVIRRLPAVLEAESLPPRRWWRYSNACRPISSIWTNRLARSNASCLSNCTRMSAVNGCWRFPALVR